MFTTFRRKLQRIKKFQKSKKAALKKYLLRLLLVQLAVLLFFIFVLHSNRPATEDNTQEVIAEGASIYIKERVRSRDSIMIVFRGETYTLTQQGWTSGRPESWAKKMQEESTIYLTVMDHLVVEARGNTTTYYDIQTYNRWHQNNMIAGIIATVLMWIFVTVLFGFDVFRLIWW